MIVRTNIEGLRIIDNQTSVEIAAEMNKMSLRIVALEEALAPFAALLQTHHEGQLDSTPIYAVDNSHVTYGDLRRAVALLSGEVELKL